MIVRVAGEYEVCPKYNYQDVVAFKGYGDGDDLRFGSILSVNVYINEEIDIVYEIAYVGCVSERNIVKKLAFSLEE